tara:strand:+ start:3999 stop:4745 length:747 start_codon:yes stop_codon:yes gene_type:complete
MKKYSKQQVFDFCDAYTLAKQEGLVDNGGHKFFDKFLESLLTIGTLIRNNEMHKWTRQKSPSFHTWLSYKDGKVILDSRRDDEWSTTLVDQCMSYFSKSEIESWVVFTKTEEYAENVALICTYYKRTGAYFRNYIARVERDEKLDAHSYNRFVNNKYASKVLIAHKAEPKFDVGSLVDFRTSREATTTADGVGSVHKKAPLGLLVLSNTEPILSACKGAKRYKVVCIGDSVPFWTEERFLKNRKKKRK